MPALFVLFQVFPSLKVEDEASAPAALCPPGRPVCRTPLEA